MGMEELEREREEVMQLYNIYQGQRRIIEQCDQIRLEFLKTLATNLGEEIKGETLEEMYFDLKQDLKRAKSVQPQLEKWTGFKVVFPPVETAENTEE